MTQVTQDITIRYTQEHEADATELGLLLQKQMTGSLSSREQARLESLKKAMSQFIVDGMANLTVPFYDVTLLKFSGSAPSYAKDVSIGGHGVRVQDNVLIAGYGLTNSYDSKAHGVLNSAYLPLVAELRQANEIRVGMEHGTASCKGDSGRPVYVERNGGLEILGVLSRGASEGGCGETDSNYTDLRQYEGWLRCHAAKLYNESGGSDCYGENNSGAELRMPSARQPQDPEPRDPEPQQPIGGGRICGQASQATHICLEANGRVMDMTNTSTQRPIRIRIPVSDIRPSQRLPGAAAYYGRANLSFISGMTAFQDIAFLINPNGEAKLLYYSALKRDWLPFGNREGTFQVSAQ